LTLLTVNVNTRPSLCHLCTSDSLKTCYTSVLLYWLLYCIHKSTERC